MPATSRFVPSLVWARPAALVIAVLGMLIPGLAGYHLLTDHECDGRASPHFFAAALVLVFSGALACGGVALQRRLARWVSRRVRVSSSFMGTVVASTTLLPAVLLGVSSAVLSAVVDFDLTFRICLNGTPPLAPLFYGWGC